jgi:hypothetical protein
MITLVESAGRLCLSFGGSVLEKEPGADLRSSGTTSSLMVERCFYFSSPAFDWTLLDDEVSTTRQCVGEKMKV